ncbi:UbiA family prenyltransferase [Ohtaekwangia koreensis]|uniref:1,4-dihydroxy-2-naphthoate octaprenyltransferase n=1 Tax=Ohtaekwangia koreensis TaxID=688867 RepID=A0A1T5LFV0_9BACT|nr:UbiA family prenyltransferase [Ohtaekwangia koreensis]SKC74724.1 1,4-dihydroxy-2-naphthoate octaprenyltransferase [Ohtaekwangia koreensis]
MFSRSSWLHLRIPFSYYLMPVFFFSLAISPNLSAQPLLWTFIVVHLFLYPASNGYNSYFDKDEKSIGGLKNPPKVKKDLYYLSLLFDAVAIVLALIKISLVFAIMIFIYGLISKAYSHPAIRLKKYPIAGWLIVSLFQGLFAFVMCYIGINRFPLENALRASVIIPGLLSSALLMGTYPMTQVYQHDEDSIRGDKTFSLMLGVRGTFLFVGALFSIVSIGYILYFNAFFINNYAWVFLGAMFPVIVFFLYWFLRVIQNESKADHKHTMWLNFISATCLNIFFIYLLLDSTQLWQMF